jgi:hypothetical protein
MFWRSFFGKSLRSNLDIGVFETAWITTFCPLIFSPVDIVLIHTIDRIVAVHLESFVYEEV